MLVKIVQFTLQENNYNITFEITTSNEKTFQVSHMLYAPTYAGKTDKQIIAEAWELIKIHVDHQVQKLENPDSEAIELEIPEEGIFDPPDPITKKIIIAGPSSVQLSSEAAYTIYVLDQYGSVLDVKATISVAPNDPGIQLVEHILNVGPDVNTETSIVLTAKYGEINEQFSISILPVSLPNTDEIAAIKAENEQLKQRLQASESAILFLMDLA